MSEVVSLIVGLVALLIGAGLGFWISRTLAQAESKNLRDSLQDANRKLAEAEAARLEAANSLRTAELESTRLDGEAKMSKALHDALLARFNDQGSELDDTRTELANARRLHADAENRIIELEGAVKRAEDRLESEKSNHAEKLAELEQARQAFSDHFANLSSQALKTSTDELIKQAKEAMTGFKELNENDINARKAEIEHLVDPIKNQLKQLEEIHQDLERRRSNEVGSLSKQLEELATHGQSLRMETIRLTKAMHNPGQAGSWGEMLLEKIIEMSGLTQGVTFATQETFKNSDGASQRPDVTIRMPSNKVVFIDSKAPMEQYLNAMETEDDAVRQASLLAFAAKVDEHVRALSKRKYSEMDEAVDFTILFLGSEGAYRAAVEARPRLIEDSFVQKVVIATPTSLFAMLKTIHYAWRHDSLSKDATEIRKLGADLYNKIATLSDHYINLGKGLQRAVKSYNDFGGSLESRVLPSARKLRELGVTDSAVIAETEVVEFSPRDLKSSEFVAELPKKKVEQLALVGPEDELQRGTMDDRA